MRKEKFTESQIVGILGEGEAGLPVAELCRKHGISNATYYQWKSKYSGGSGEKRFDFLFMALSSQSLEPPQNPGRFI